MPIDEENADIRQIHEEYKNLVDFMLGSFMEEMHITPEQFELACLEGRQQGQGENPFQFHQVLFQQVSQDGSAPSSPITRGFLVFLLVLLIDCSSPL